MKRPPHPAAKYPSAAPALAVALMLAAPARAASGEPPACQVTVVAQPPTPSLGVDKQATLAVSVTGEGALLAQPGRVQATVGTVDPLEPGDAPGTFRTVYHLPSERRPQAALIAIEVMLPSGARPRATLRLPLPANTIFPFKTTPTASVTIEIAGRTFGPAVADAQGNVAIPITVPPGVEVGKAIARGRFGGSKTREIGLQTRDYPRLLLLAPSEAEAGAEVSIEALALNPDGSGATPEDIDLRASAGAVRRTDGEPGLARFALKLPEFVDEGPVALTAAMSDGASEVARTIALHPGPAVTLAISASHHLLQVGSNEIEELEIAARDRLGNDTVMTGLSVTAGGVPLPLEVTGELATTRFPAPIAWSGDHKLPVVARLGALVGRKEILLTGGEPAKVRVAGSRPGVAADGFAAVDLIADISDSLGIPTTTSRILWSTTDEGTLEVLPSPRFGAYAARFIPAPGVHDRRAIIVVAAEPDLRASTQVEIETTQTPTATARVGVLTNLSGSFGQTVFMEGAVPLGRKSRWARLFSLGLSVGYIHSGFTRDVPPRTPMTPMLPIDFNQEPVPTGIRLSLNQLPLLGFVRLHVPTPRLPVGLSVSGFAGYARAWSEIIETTEGTQSHPGANLAMVGLGTDLAFRLRPGQVVFGVRYIATKVARLSTGDLLMGNAGGLLLDFGFRLHQ